MGLDVLDVLNHGLGSRNICSIALDVMQCIAKLVDVLGGDPSFLLCRLFTTFIFFLGMRALLLINILIPLRIERNGEGICLPVIISVAEDTKLRLHFMIDSSFTCLGASPHFSVRSLE